MAWMIARRLSLEWLVAGMRKGQVSCGPLRGLRNDVNDKRSGFEINQDYFLIHGATTIAMTLTSDSRTSSNSGMSSNSNAATLVLDLSPNRGIVDGIEVGCEAFLRDAKGQGGLWLRR